MSNEQLHPSDPAESDPSVAGQPTIGRRDLVINLALAGVFAKLQLLGVASATERTKRHLVDIVTPDLLSPINLPKLGIHSEQLDKLPLHIQRIILFFSMIDCHGCEDFDKRMRREWSSLPADIVVIPVDVGEPDTDVLQKTDEELRASLFKMMRYTRGDENSNPMIQWVLNILRDKYLIPIDALTDEQINAAIGPIL